MATKAEQAGAPSLPTEDNKFWHYSASGTSYGPVSADELKALYGNGAIYEDTLVWSERRGGDWQAYSHIPELAWSGVKPPLPSREVTDFWVWAIAAVPIIGYVIEVWLTGDHAAPTPMSILPYAFTYGILASCDASAIRKSGRSEKRGLAALGFFLVPLYLIIRSKWLSKPQWPIIAWVAAVAATIYVPAENIMSFTALNFSLPACNSSTSVAQIKTMFPDIPLNLGKLPASDLSDIKTTSSTDQRNECAAVVHSGAGMEFPVTYSIEDQGGQYVYYLNLSF